MQTHKISKQTFDATPVYKVIRMTPAMFRMCVDSNISSFEKKG